MSPMRRLAFGMVAWTTAACHMIADVDELEVGTAPSNTGLPTISGLAQVEQQLSAKTGSWLGSMPLKYAYQWQRCNAAGGDCVDIEDANDPTYLLVQADEDSKLRVNVTGTNALGSASATSLLTDKILAPIVGKVDTAGAPVTIRSGPGTNYSAVGTVVDGENVTIHCQAKGETVTGTFGTSNLWDDIGPGFIADVYVFTNSDFQVAPWCP
jgi:hypothetical protein